MSDKEIIITIDVEAHRDLIEIWGPHGNDDYGLRGIVNLLNQYHAKGTFFVDVAEETKWGPSEIQKIFDYLRSESQDVQLHIHPKYYKNGLDYFHQYSLEEQQAIIERGIESFQKYGAQDPICFRAGGYSINKNTILALKQSGLLADSSYYFDRKECKYKANQINIPFNIEGVQEIPITVYRYMNYGGSLTRYHKIDIYWSLESEIKHSLASIEKSDLPYVILFLHSSALMTRSGKMSYSPSRTYINRFANILQLIDNSSVYRVSTISEYLYLNNNVNGQGFVDYVPQIRNPIYQYFGLLSRIRLTSAYKPKLKWILLINNICWGFIILLILYLILS